MDAGTFAIVLALLAGSIRALVLWRASIGVAVVNVAVLGALVEGHGQSLRTLLRRSGSGWYLDVAGAIGQSALDLSSGEHADDELQKRLRHAAHAAIFAANRRLQRHAWLGHFSLAAIAFAGFDVTFNASAGPLKAGGMVAATLLWVANVRTARSIATRIYVGANALVDSLLASLDQIRAAAADASRT